MGIDDFRLDLAQDRLNSLVDFDQTKVFQALLREVEESKVAHAQNAVRLPAVRFDLARRLTAVPNAGAFTDDDTGDAVARSDVPSYSPPLPQQLVVRVCCNVQDVQEAPPFDEAVKSPRPDSRCLSANADPDVSSSPSICSRSRQTGPCPVPARSRPSEKSISPGAIFG